MAKVHAAVSVLLLSIFIALVIPQAMSLKATSTIWQPVEIADRAEVPAADPSVTTLTTQVPLTGTQFTSFLPVITRAYRPHPPCTPQSLFGVQVAALGQVEPLDREAESSLTEAEWLAVFDEAFPSLVAALRVSGACWARVRVDWAWIQPDPPPAPYVWGPYHDEKLALIAETGVQLIAHIDDVPGWAGVIEGQGPITDDRLDEFAQFLTDLVNRYKQPPYNIHTWELFNEPDWSNYDPTFGWGRQGAKYAAMLAVASPTIKAADPSATVLLGGLAYDNFHEYAGPFYRYFIDNVAIAGGAPLVDAFNLHYFPDFAAEWERWVPGGSPPTCGVVDDGIGAPYDGSGIDVIAKVNHLRNRLHTCYGVDKPLWLTEIGEHGIPGQADSEAQQARYVIQGLARALAAGAEKVIWYALVSPDYDPHDQGLLYQDDWSPKPAFYTYQTLTYDLAGWHYLHTLEVPGVEGYVFGSASGPEKTIAWANGDPLQPAYLTFANASQLRVLDRWGHATMVYDGGVGDVDGTQNFSITLELPAPPVDPDPNTPILTAEPLIISR